MDLLDRITEVVAPVCAQCDDLLGGSPSDDFCSQECQTRWIAHENDVRELVGYREPWDRPNEFPGVGGEGARWADGQGWRPATSRVVRISPDGRWTFTVTPEEAARVVNEFNAAMRPAIEGLTEAFRSVAASLAPIARHLEQRRAVPAAKSPDPMHAALEARRHRNTGPRVHADPRLNRR